MKHLIRGCGLGGILLILGILFSVGRLGNLQLGTGNIQSPDINQSLTEDTNFDSKKMTDAVRSGVEAQRVANAQMEAEKKAFHDQEQLRLAEEEARKAEAQAYWDSRQDWIQNFPFKPTFHADVTYDPALFDLDLSLIDEPDPEQLKAYSQMFKMVENHGFLRGFYINPNRFSPEFEKIHEIFAEEGIDPDPLICGWTYTHLADYHKASLHDLDQPWTFDESITWREKRNRTWNSILNRLVSRDAWIVRNESLFPKEHAELIRERLIQEIPPDGFLNVDRQEDFVFNSAYEEELQAGDPMLIR